MTEFTRLNLETDPRFPSGRWEGHWTQHGLRGDMELDLTFRARLVRGRGRDRVGDFAISGAYSIDTGAAIIHKQYLGAHRLLYWGHAERKHGLFGWWCLLKPPCTGGWRIWPIDEGGAMQSEREAIDEPHPLATASI